MDEDATWYGGRPRPRPHCVTWGPSSPQKAQLPNFRPMSVVAKRLDGLRCQLVRRYRPWPRPHCVRRGPSSPPRKGAQQPPTFRPMSIVAKRSPSQLLLISCKTCRTVMDMYLIPAGCAQRFTPVYYALRSRDGHETSVAETETRPRRWPHQPRRDRDETFKFRDETETRRLQVSRRDRYVKVHVYYH